MLTCTGHLARCWYLIGVSYPSVPLLFLPLSQTPLHRSPRPLQVRVWSGHRNHISSPAFERLEKGESSSQHSRQGRRPDSNPGPSVPLAPRLPPWAHLHERLLYEPPGNSPHSTDDATRLWREEKLCAHPWPDPQQGEGLGFAPQALGSRNELFSGIHLFPAEPEDPRGL